MNDQSWGPGGVKPPSDEETSTALESLHSRKRRRESRMKAATGAGVTAIAVVLALAIANKPSGNRNQAATTVAGETTVTTTAPKESALKGRLFAATLEGLVEMNPETGNTLSVLVEESKLDPSGHDAPAISKIVTDDANNRVLYLYGDGNGNCGGSQLKAFEFETESSVSLAPNVYDFDVNTADGRIVEVTGQCSSTNEITQTVEVVNVDGKGSQELLNRKQLQPDGKRLDYSSVAWKGNNVLVVDGQRDSDAGFMGASTILSIDPSDPSNTKTVVVDSKRGAAEKVLGIDQDEFLAGFAEGSAIDGSVDILRVLANATETIASAQNKELENLKAAGVSRDGKTVIVSGYISSQLGLGTSMVDIYTDGTKHRLENVRTADIG